VRLPLAGEKVLAQHSGAYHTEQGYLEQIVMITSTYLKECLKYNSETGIFIWKTRPEYHFKTIGAHNTWNTRFSSTIAGTDDGIGYVRIILRGNRYRAHRLAWLYMTGEFPLDQIDHINGKRSDNSIKNLRQSDDSDNRKNMKRRDDNSSGATGVSWHKRAKKWNPKIQVGKKQIHLGLFDSFDDAVKVRKLAEIKYGFHENHGRIIYCSRFQVSSSKQETHPQFTVNQKF